MPICFNVKKFLPAVLLVLGLLFFWPGPAAQAAPNSIGQVMNLNPGAFVTRDGRTEPLVLKAQVRAADTIHTDATGRVRLLFNDDSAVSLGPDTTLNLEDYADSGAKPVFNVHLGRGLARLVTGKITEANPAGFKASTPEVVVGIRGTDIILQAVEGATRVLVKHSLRQVLVNGLNLPGGQQMLVSQPGAVGTPEPIDPGLLEKFTGTLAVSDGQGRSRGQGRDKDYWLTIPQKGTDLADLPLNAKATLKDSTSPLSPSGLSAAYIQTTILPAGFTFLELRFDVNLGSGNIHYSEMNGLNSAFTGGGFTLYGGTGQVTGGNFHITNFTSGWGGADVSSSRTYMQSSSGSAFTPGNSSATVDFSVGVAGSSLDVTATGITVPYYGTYDENGNFLP